ncbi:hypothetical protein [Methanolobus sp.]|jgi:hypothetical protein|uniref:hypothetical protein n=1 Tax=Methanolobus sp. TaxID=1874737 RepID=UPI0034582CEB
MMLSYAVVQYLYDYSDRQMEYEAQVNIIVSVYRTKFGILSNSLIEFAYEAIYNYQ